MAKDDAQLRCDIISAAPILRRFAYALARNAMDADDLTQSTIERVLAKGVPEDVETLRWMYTVCRNLWIDTMRAQKTRRDAEPTLDALSGAHPGPDKEAADRQMLANTTKAIDALPEIYREILAMIVLGGASYQEAAETLDVPLGTVMSRLARARASLAETVQYYD